MLIQHADGAFSGFYFDSGVAVFSSYSYKIISRKVEFNAKWLVAVGLAGRPVILS